MFKSISLYIFILIPNYIFLIILTIIFTIKYFKENRVNMNNEKEERMVKDFVLNKIKNYLPLELQTLIAIVFYLQIFKTFLIL